MRKIDNIVIHCTAGSAQQSAENIKDYWARVLGWKSYGYHWLVNADGSCERLADDEKPTNGVRGHNSNSIHLCYKGGWNGTDTRTPEQKEALINLVKQYKRKYPKARVLGHRDFSPDLNRDGKITPNEWIKICPCFNAIDEYKNV